MKKINISDKSYEVIKFSNQGPKLHNRKWNWERDTWSNYSVWKIVIKSNSLDIDYVMRRRGDKKFEFFLKRKTSESEYHWFRCSGHLESVQGLSKFPNGEGTWSLLLNVFNDEKVDKAKERELVLDELGI
jgi:hypothetical protein